MAVAREAPFERIAAAAAHADNNPASGTFRVGADSVLDSVFNDRSLDGSSSLSRWMGWRLRLLVVAALTGCVGLLMVARELAAPLHIDASWRADMQGRIELVAAADPALKPHLGQTLTQVGSVSVDGLALRRASRWLTDDTQRAQHQALTETLFAAVQHGRVRLVFGDTGAVEVQAQQRGFAGLPPIFWLLCGLALVLYLVAMVVVLAKPTSRNLVYAVMALCQAGNVLFIAVEATQSLGLPPAFAQLDMPVRVAFDLFTAAAMVNAVCLHPRLLPAAGWIASATWAGAIGLAGLIALGWLASVWWWAQGSLIGLGLLAIALLSWSYRIEAHPFAVVLRRFGIVTWATLTLLTAAVALSEGLDGAPYANISAIGSMVWYVFLGTLLLLVPFMSHSQQVMREFSLLAAISTVATSLDLLFVAVFSLGQFASLTLSLFISLGVYSGARQWILNQLLGTSMLTTERMFEQLYRIAREVEAHPDRTPALLGQLLRDLFEPMEVALTERRSTLTRVAGDGSTLLVPVPMLGGDVALSQGSITIRFAQRGRRLFTHDDARLTDRIVEQLRRAVAFDKAVEQGRSEERLRLAQDLHDDIGARLLTLMYKAQSPEMEEYVRHTLQDLKTLTRGLAAPNHRLSHAAAEWKADLSQRLTAAHVALGWSCDFDSDMLLTVVQWSGLTRVLRELVSNAIAHAQARRVDIDLSLQGDRLQLTVTDDGSGRNPRAWSHGLGLGGVRKRVKQLGGEVEWREAEPAGISCRVTIRDWSERV
jgi:signal transduction histidine kinase